MYRWRNAILAKLHRLNHTFVCYDKKSKNISARRRNFGFQSEIIHQKIQNDSFKNLGSKFPLGTLS
jgi:hypothetical protein